MDLRLILFLTISVLAAALLARMIPVGKGARRGSPPGRPGAAGGKGDPNAQAGGRAEAGGGQRARGPGGRGGPPRMTASLAREVLGVPSDASPDDVRQAYRRLISKNHPDVGGSAWITQRLNEARDALIGPGAR